MPLVSMPKQAVQPATPWPALLVRSDQGSVLIVADLHIGFEHSLSESGMSIPSQMPKLLKRLEEVIDRYRPQKLLFLGDVKHGIPSISDYEWEEIPTFFEKLLQRISDITVVPGNHDGDLEPLLPREVKLVEVTGIRLSAKGFWIGLFHGHAWPSPEVVASDLLVIGHNHPTAQFRDALGLRIIRPVWVRAWLRREELAKAFLRQRGVKRVEGSPIEAFEERYGLPMRAESLVVMPSFNEFFGGIKVNAGGNRFLGPVMRSGAVDIDCAEVYLLDGTFLGSIEFLRSLYAE